jgi:hypothetical protein
MTHTLVAKFSNVQVKHSALLPPEDLEYCRQEQQYLQETLQQLTQWRGLLEAINETENNPAYTIGKKYDWRDEEEVSDVYRYGSSTTTRRDMYNRQKFTIKYSLLWVRKQPINVKEYFIDGIVNYFQSKYQVDIPSFYKSGDETSVDRYLTYESIIEAIKTSMGGHLNFSMVGIEKAIKAFRKSTVDSYHSKPEQKGRIITIPNYTWTNEGNFSRDFRDKYIKPLNDMVSIFETDNLCGDDYMLGSAIHGQSINFEREYDVINGHRLESVRFYKNRKVAIKFKTVQDATDFMNRFQLTSFGKD